MGVVVRRYIDIFTIILNFPYSSCIRSFFSSSILTSLFIFLFCFGLVEVCAERKRPKKHIVEKITLFVYKNPVNMFCISCTGYECVPTFTCDRLCINHPSTAFNQISFCVVL